MSNATAGAFPFPHYTRPDGDIHWGEQGLTKREYFAAMAMQGMQFSDPQLLRTEENIAEMAVRQADALLAALAK